MAHWGSLYIVVDHVAKLGSGDLTISVRHSDRYAVVVACHSMCRCAFWERALEYEIKVSASSWRLLLLTFQGWAWSSLQWPDEVEVVYGMLVSECF